MSSDGSKGIGASRKLTANKENNASTYYVLQVRATCHRYVLRTCDTSVHGEDNKKLASNSRRLGVVSICFLKSSGVSYKQCLWG
jgi:hypothetical protein